MDRGLQGRGHGALGRVLVAGVHTLRDPVAGVVTGHALPGPAAPLELTTLPVTRTPAPSLQHSPAPQALQLAAVTLQSSEMTWVNCQSIVTDLMMILGQDVKLVPVNVQDSCGKVRVGGELTLEVIQRSAVKQVTAAALG